MFTLTLLDNTTKHVAECFVGTSVYETLDDFDAASLEGFAYDMQERLEFEDNERDRELTRGEHAERVEKFRTWFHVERGLFQQDAQHSGGEWFDEWDEFLWILRPAKFEKAVANGLSPDEVPPSA